MLGTIVNVIAIILGSILGLILKGKFNSKLQEITVQATGLAVIFSGASTTFETMINEPCNPVLFVVSIVIGGIVGTLIDIDGKIKGLGDKIDKKCQGRGGSISKSFIGASVLYCTGSMAIIGSINSGLYQDYTILFTKSVLDGINSIIFASAMGFGVIFSSITVFVYQGAITFLAGIVEPYLTGDIMREISIVGGLLITGLGIDMLGMRKINVANLLPAVIVPVIYYGIVYIIK